MNDQLTIENQTISYNIQLSRKARRMRISVGRDTGVVVTLPQGLSLAWAKKLVRQKQRWILKSVNYFRKFKGRTIIPSSRREFLLRRSEATKLATDKVGQWNKFYGFSYNRISVKNQKTRWGSCSKKGNLNFNYKIVHLPENLVDYLAVHELCHLRELNHSRRFWELVGTAIPDYKLLRRQLRNYGTAGI